MEEIKSKVMKGTSKWLLKRIDRVLVKEIKTYIENIVDETITNVKKLIFTDIRKTDMNNVSAVVQLRKKWGDL